MMKMTPNCRGNNFNWTCDTFKIVESKNKIYIFF